MKINQTLKRKECLNIVAITVPFFQADLSTVSPHLVHCNPNIRETKEGGARAAL